MATLFKVDGTEAEVQPEGKKFKRLQMKALIDCEWIEIIHCGNQLMVINEEGKFANNAVINQKATEIAKPYLFDGDYIVGNALVCKNGEIH